MPPPAALGEVCHLPGMSSCTATSSKVTGLKQLQMFSCFPSSLYAARKNQQRRARPPVCEQGTRSWHKELRALPPAPPSQTSTLALFVCPMSHTLVSGTTFPIPRRVAF